VPELGIESLKDWRLQRNLHFPTARQSQIATVEEGSPVVRAKVADYRGQGHRPQGERPSAAGARGKARRVSGARRRSQGRGGQGLSARPPAASGAGVPLHHTPVTSHAASDVPMVAPFRVQTLQRAGSHVNE
jgi:hypothetical protein